MRISTIQAFNNSVSGISRNYADLTRAGRNQCRQAPADPGRRPGRRRPAASAEPGAGAQQSIQVGHHGSEEQPAAGGDHPQFGRHGHPSYPRDRRAGRQRRPRRLGQETLATELAQREDELLNLLNSRDASGKYLFSGSGAIPSRSFATRTVPTPTTATKASVRYRSPAAPSLPSATTARSFSKAAATPTGSPPARDAAGLDASGNPATAASPWAW